MELTESPGDYLTVDEIASTMRVAKMTVYRMIKRGELPSVRFGRSFRVSRAEFDAYVAKAAVAA